MYSNIQSSFVFRGFLMVVLRNCGFASRIKIHHSDHSIDRSANIRRQLEREFEPCHLMFKGSKECKKKPPLQCTCKEKKKI